MRRRGAGARAAALALFALVSLALARRTLAWTAAEGEAELGSIEARYKAQSAAPQRDAKALVELDARAQVLARQASSELGRMRESAAERDADMAAVVASADWRSIEAMLLKLRFRIASIELDRALAGDPDRTRLARAAADGFSSFADAPDPELAAESRYGRGLARIAAGDREAGIGDLRAASSEPSVAPRARLALAEALAEGGQNGQALDLVTRELAGGGLPRDLALRAKLLRLKLLLAARPTSGRAASNAPSPPAAGSPAARGAADIGVLANDLIAAGEPWRGAALALFRGNEDLLPSGPAADAVALRLRAEAAARRGDAIAALAAYRDAIAHDPGHDDPALLEGLARAALAAGDPAQARSALARLHGPGHTWTRELALIDLRSAYAVWQKSRDAESAAAVAAAAESVRQARGATPEDLAEASYRTAELARAAGDADRALAGFSSIDAPAWRVAAQTAALQCRAVRATRDPAKESRAALLRDLAAWIARTDLPPDARATAVVLDATLRTSGGGPPVRGQPTAEPLDPAAQRAALARVQDFAARYPGSPELLPPALRARALLELEVGGRPDPETLDALAAEARPAVAAQIAGDLRDEALRLPTPARPPEAPASSPPSAADDRARRALAGALAFAALAPPGDGSASRVALAQRALELGEPAIATELFQAELAQHLKSLAALRGLALAARASGDQVAARAAWDRLAAQPDLPAAMREEADRERSH